MRADFLRLIRSSVALVWAASPGRFAIIAAAQAASAASAVAQVLVARELFKSGLTTRGLEPLLPWLGAAGGLAAVLGLLRVFESEQGRVLAETVNREALGRILDVTLSAELILFEDPAFHDRVQRSYMQAQSRTMHLVSSLLAAIGALISAVCLVAAVASLQLLLLPILIVGYIPVLLLSRSNSNDSYEFSLGMTQNDRQRAYLQQLMIARDPAKEIRAADLGPYLRAYYERLYDERVSHFVQLASRRTSRAMRAAILRFTASAVAGGAVAWLYVSHRITLAALGAALVALAQLGARLQALHTNGASLYESSLFLHDYIAFAESTDSSTTAKRNERVVGHFTGVCVRNLTFTYPTGRHPALENVSLEVEPGETIALVGENGSGKTTLAKLLAGLYEPQEGVIYWSGVDTRELDAKLRRSQVAILFQDFQRYALTVRENISVGDHTRTDGFAHVLEAAELAGASSFVDRLPRRYDTLLGSEFWGGTELSIGQWQRLALARAFFRDSPLLIFDEPTSALDPVAEADFLWNVRGLFRDRAVVVISHRLSSVSFADRIYVLSNGKIVETGGHSDLVQRGGVYADLVNLQSTHAAGLDGTALDRNPLAVNRC